MPKLFYIARDNKGDKVTGSEEAATPDELAIRLQSKNLTVIGILPHTDANDMPVIAPTVNISRKRHGRFAHYGIRGEDLALLCRQLATLLSSGVTILKSLEIISQQVASQRLYKVINKLKSDMEQGFSFHDAMSKHQRIFSDLWINLVESGEASGNLAVVLGRLAGYLERNAAFKRKVISAVIYPAILLFVGIAALLFLTIVVVPKFDELFRGFNLKLPMITRMLMGVSILLRKAWFAVVIIIGVAAWFIKQYLGTRAGRRQYEEIQFRLPVLGEFFRAIVVERFSSEMSTLIESGVPILYALEITERSVDNLIMAEIIKRVKEDVRQGKTLSQPLEKSGFFEPMVVQMISVGEEIGELPQMFKRVNTFYQEYVETFLTRFTSMLEPLILIFMGVIIGIMVIGMFLPIFQISRISA